MAIWATGLLYLTNRSEKKRLLQAHSDQSDEKLDVAAAVGALKV